MIDLSLLNEISKDQNNSEYLHSSDSPFCDRFNDGNELPQKNEFTKLDNDYIDSPIKITQETRNELEPLNEETKDALKEKKCSDAIIEKIQSNPEGQIYASSETEAVIINGKEVLARTDINLEQIDIDGKTNLERMQEGKSPLDENGKPYELHHIGQKPDSPLIELKQEEHRGSGNDNILHNKMDESKIDRTEFAKERADHWKSRAELILNPNN